MYEHLTPEQREDLLRLQRKTVHTMNDAERARLQAYQAPRPIELVAPPGQLVVEPFEESTGGPVDRNPYIGLWVTYYSRPGEGRDAKTRFPAMVMGVSGLDPGTDRWKVHLAVHYTATESTDVICLQRTEADRFGVWDYVDDPMWHHINNLLLRVSSLEERLGLGLQPAQAGAGALKPPRPKSNG
jgi:hypothetical protein